MCSLQDIEVQSKWLFFVVIPFDNGIFIGFVSYSKHMTSFAGAHHYYDADGIEVVLGFVN